MRNSDLARAAVTAAVLVVAAAAAAATDTTPGPAPVPARAAGRTVAVTVDDLPGNAAEAPTAARQVDINRRIVATLDARDIPAVGFVNENKLYRDGELDPGRVAALVAWLDAGLELGNHTFSHPSLNRTPLEEWLADVERGSLVTRDLLAARERTLRWFRHPFLHTGRDLETKHAAEAALARQGLTVAPVTIDNGEWIYARAYLLADEAGDDAARGRIADDYVRYMADKTAYFERQSAALFDREIPQVLLVHANRLNADHFDRIAAMLAGRGYRFVTLDDALADAAYESPDTFTGAAGITWLHRWALSRTPRAPLVPDEPRTPEWILDAAGVESE